MLKNQNIFSIAMSVLGCASILTSTQVLAQYNYYNSGSFSSNINTYPPIDGGKRWKTPSGGNSTKVKKRSTSRVSANNNNSLPYTRDRELSAKIREEYLQDVERRYPSIVADLRAGSISNRSAHRLKRANQHRIAKGIKSIVRLDRNLI